MIVEKKKISPNDLVAIFMGIITKSENYYKHPTKKNILVTPQNSIKIDGSSFDSFISYFNRNYTPQEKMRFAEISDRLIEDTNRRNKGEFYTPTLFVDYAHTMIAKEFGEDWKEKFVVWDNSAGSCNLTRDYYFKELYSSTLEQAELDISENYNKEATKFQFDFLNDPLDKLPTNLIKAFEENKPIIFFMNPPYATSDNKMGDGTSKAGVAKTMINKIMLEHKIGSSSQNLYAQFIYRIMLIKRQYNLTNCHICMFSPTKYFTGPSWKGFRKAIFQDFGFAQGCMLQASHFADVANNWGISFSIWKDSLVNISGDYFPHTLIDKNGMDIVPLDIKFVYNLDNTESASDWAKAPIKHLKTFESINLKSALSIQPINSRGRIFENALGYLLNAGNNIAMNTQKVGLFSAAYGNGHGHGLSTDNFTRCTTLFAARTLIMQTWYNSQDEYMKPFTKSPDWNEFETSSIIFSLFSNKSQQSSLRSVEYKGERYDVKNEFFWLSKEEMMTLANENNNDYCYNDARVSTDRYVYNLLKGKTLSTEAQAVLDKASDIVRKTFKYRELFNEDNEKYQINNWDCGWYQIKALAKEYAKDDFEEFRTLFKALSDKMRPMVYELGVVTVN